MSYAYMYLTYMSNTYVYLTKKKKTDLKSKINFLPSVDIQED